MRFVSQILVGAAAATLLAMGAPVAANAATATPVQTATTVTATAPYFFDTWGPYFSGDGKAEARGKVTVEKKSHRQWYWKKYFKVVKKCAWHHGQKKCAWVKQPYKKHVWKWVHEYHYTVNSQLTTHKWWGNPKHRCAWETFKVVSFDGSTSFKSFYNCHKSPKFFSFQGKNAQDIFVKVSRGNQSHANGYHSGWKSVYSHA